jgi:DNA-directed RNA polymerase subunit alpha
MTIEELDLSVRAFNCLKPGGRPTPYGDLASKSPRRNDENQEFLARSPLKRLSPRSSLWALNLNKEEE